MARKKFDHFLIGKVSTDLKESFMTPFNLDPEMDMSDQLPFTGPQCQLPSQMNVLKLRLFMKDSSGKKNSNKTASTFNAKTALVVSKYWEMAGFKTWHIDAIRNGVDRLVKRYKMFKRFRDNFRYVDTSGPIAILDVDNKDELVSFYTDMLLKQKKDGSIFHRDDYREAAKLALVLIGGELPEGQMMAYKKPGACHKARILAFAIYVLKILIFRNQNIVREICFSRKEEKGKKARLIFEEETLSDLKRIGLYAVKLYIPHFLTSSTGVDAPYNDLNLYKNLEKFKQVEEDLAKEVLKVLGRNLWYLTEIIILFSLFSSRMDDDMKSRIAAKLVSLTPDDTIQFGLPTYPDLTPTMELSVLITGKSWKFFNITGTGSEWLTKPVTEWESDGEFVKARNFVLHVKTVNDTAERAVKLASEYVNILTKDSKTRQKIIQVVEKARKERPDNRKSTLDK